MEVRKQKSGLNKERNVVVINSRGTCISAKVTVTSARFR